MITNQITILCGDAEDILKQLPPCSVDCIFTSPPPITDTTKLVTISKILGEKCKRVLKPTGNMFVHMEDYFDDQGSLTQYCNKFESRMHDYYKWIVRGRLIWYMRQAGAQPGKRLVLIDPRTGLPSDRNRFRLDYSYIYHFTNARYGYFFDNEELEFTNSSIYEELYKYPQSPDKTGFSESLIMMILEVCCPHGGTVLDTFAGTGTTGDVAVHMGYNFIGIEKDERNVAIIEKRLKGIKT